MTTEKQMQPYGIKQSDLARKTTTSTEDIISRAKSEARAEAIEDCAKVAENFQNSAVAIGISGNAAVYDELSTACERIADAIRSLTKAGKGE